MLDLVEKMKELSEEGKYKEQGELFLKETGTTLTVVEAMPQKPPAWGKPQDSGKHIHYSVTLKNAKHSYTFDFWGSINDYNIVKLAEERGGETHEVATFIKNETGKDPGVSFMMRSKVVKQVRKLVEPTTYDILSTFGNLSCDSFEDFCDNFGYDTDSRRAEKTYRALQEQERNLLKLFTHDEIEALSYIV